MRCECCHGIMMNGSSRTVLDDSGTLAITAWGCSSCDGVMEEIQILSRHEKAKPPSIRYTDHNAQPNGLRFPRDGSGTDSEINEVYHVDDLYLHDRSLPRTRKLRSAISKERRKGEQGATHERKP